MGRLGIFLKICRFYLLILTFYKDILFSNLVLSTCSDLFAGIFFCEEIKKTFFFVSVNEVVAIHDPINVSFYDGNDSIEIGKHFLIDFSHNYRD
jgi:hypothetical protein